MGVGKISGGEGGIRTHGGCYTSPHFECGALDRALRPLRRRPIMMDLFPQIGTVLSSLHPKFRFADTDRALESRPLAHVQSAGPSRQQPHGFL